MRQVFGPGKTFSITAPEPWLEQSQADRLAINAPDGGAALAATGWQTADTVSLRQFADARFSGVSEMNIYRQIGKEYTIGEQGCVVREYEGRWPGDGQITSYTVACVGNPTAYVAMTITTDRRDYRRNRRVYRDILASLRVY